MAGPVWVSPESLFGNGVQVDGHKVGAGLFPAVTPNICIGEHRPTGTAHPKRFYDSQIAAHSVSQPVSNRPLLISPRSTMGQLSLQASEVDGVLAIGRLRLTGTTQPSLFAPRMYTTPYPRELKSEAAQPMFAPIRNVYTPSAYKSFDRLLADSTRA